jgi:Domain of unknown function (DUF6894)
VRRYFFDRVSCTRSEFDFRGSELATVERAAEMAELIALDLAVENASAWTGWAVKVRNALGQHFFTIPVQELDHVIA